MKVPQIHKLEGKQSKFGGHLDRYNARRNSYIDALTALKDKNQQLKRFDESEHLANSYDTTLQQQHLFMDAEESHLTKLDLRYANQHFVYNEGLISVDLPTTVSIQYACEHLTVVPLALLLDRLITTDGYMFLEMYLEHTD